VELPIYFLKVLNILAELQEDQQVHPFDLGVTEIGNS
jgi:hypothetical protein